MVLVLIVLVVLCKPTSGITPEELRDNFLKKADEAEIDTATAVCGERINTIAAGCNCPKTGALLREIPYDEWATAAGAINGGDYEGCMQAFVKGLTKAAVAHGTEAGTSAVITGITGATEATLATALTTVGAGIAVALIAGWVYDYALTEYQQDIQRSMDKEIASMAEDENQRTLSETRRKCEYEQKIAFWRSAMDNLNDMKRWNEFIIWMARKQALYDLDTTHKKLTGQITEWIGMPERSGPKMTQEEAAAEIDQINQKLQSFINNYDADMTANDKKLKELKSKSWEAPPTELEEHLNEVWGKFLKVRDDIERGGYDEATYKKLHVLYQSYLDIQKKLKDLKNTYGQCTESSKDCTFGQCAFGSDPDAGAWNQFGRSLEGTLT